MANRYAVASGNWSDTATWDGGTLPDPGDVVRPNNFTVTIDQDITVDELRRDAESPAVAGGQFDVSSGTRIITADIFGSVYVLSAANATINGNLTPLAASALVHRSSGLVTVNGNVTGSSSTNLTRGVIFQALANGRLVVNGSVNGGTTTGSRQGIIIDPATSGPSTGRTVTVIGNVQANGGHGIDLSGLASLIVAGNVMGGNAGIGIAMSVDSADFAGRSIIVFGNVMGTSDPAATGGGTTGRGLNISTAHAISVLVYGSAIGRIKDGLVVTGSTVSGTIAVRGGATGGSTSSARGVFNASSSPVTIGADAVGGSNIDAHGVFNSSTGTVTIAGNLVTNPSGAQGAVNTGGGTLLVGVSADNRYTIQALVGDRDGNLEYNWYRNSEPVEPSDVGSPTYQLSIADQVVASGNMTVGSHSLYLPLLSAPIVRRTGYMLTTTATIDGATRTQRQPIRIS